MNYWTVTSSTVDRHKSAIEAFVGRVSIEEVPMISFLRMDATDVLAAWIVDTVA